MSAVTNFLKCSMAASAAVYAGCRAINSPRLDTIKKFAAGVFLGAAAVYWFHKEEPVQAQLPPAPARGGEPQPTRAPSHKVGVSHELPKTPEQAIQEAEANCEIFEASLNTGRPELDLYFAMNRSFEAAKEICKNSEPFQLLEMKFKHLTSKAPPLPGTSHNGMPQAPQPQRQLAAPRPLLEHAAPEQAFPVDAIDPKQTLVFAESCMNNFERFLKENLPQDTDDYIYEKNRLAKEMFDAFNTAKQVCSQDERRILQYKYDPLMAECAPFDAALLTQYSQRLGEVKAALDRAYPKANDFLSNFVVMQQRDNAINNLINFANRIVTNKFITLDRKTLECTHIAFGIIESKYSLMLQKEIMRPASQAFLEQHEALSPYLDRNYRVERVPGDGNCLFHSMKQQLGPNDPSITAESLRKAAVDLMRDNDDYNSIIIERVRNDHAIQREIPGFQQMPPKTLVNRYLDIIERNGTLGGKPELTALSQICRHPIMIQQKGKFNDLDVDDVILILPTNGCLTTTPLLLQNSGEGHFEPLVKR